MKLLVASLAFGLAIASPAFAKPQRHVPAEQAFAYVPVQRLPNPDRRTPVQHSPNPNWDAHSGSGKYIGSDPDIRIRQDMLKDSYLGHAGASH